MRNAITAVRHAFPVASVQPVRNNPVAECNACLVAPKENSLGVRVVGAFSKTALEHTSHNLKNALDPENYKIKADHFSPAILAPAWTAPLRAAQHLAHHDFDLRSALRGSLKDTELRLASTVR